MADVVGSLTKIVDVALKIKKAVDTVRQNRKDCYHIRSRVERVRHTLSLCERNTELMESPAVLAAVEALGEVLDEALELVTGCQEETTAVNAVCLCCRAGKLSKQLSKVDRGISDLNSEATFAILVYHISRQTQDSARPALPPEMPERITECALSPQQIEPCVPHPPITPEEYTPTFGRVREEKPSGGVKVSCSTQRRASTAYMQSPIEHLCVSMPTCGGPPILLPKIGRVAVKIKAVAEMVRQKKEDCAEISRRASKVSCILSRLEDTGTKEDPTVMAALRRILKTFHRAHAAVMACQRRSIVIFVCHSPFQPRKLSDELCRVLDEMLLDLDVLIAILPSVHAARDRAI